MTTRSHDILDQNMPLLDQEMLQTKNGEINDNTIQKSYTCAVCQASLPTAKDLVHHVQTAHSPDMKVDSNPRPDVNKINHSKHSSEVKTGNNQSFENEFNFLQLEFPEFFSVLKEETVETTLNNNLNCDEILNSSVIFEEDPETGKPKRKFACQWCSAKFTRKPNLKIHIASVHEGFIQKCNICIKSSAHLQITP